MCYSGRCRFENYQGDCTGKRNGAYPCELEYEEDVNGEEGGGSRKPAFTDRKAKPRATKAGLAQVAREKEGKTMEAKHNETQKITEMRMENGQLPAYAFPGGYPMYYLDKENNVLCPKCANENDDFSAPIIAAGINYEDAHLHCDHCSTRIESAYADDAEAAND